MAETVGQRLYLIRLACGDGVRDPESLKEFSARVKRATKQHFDPMTLSLLERMKQGWTLDNILTLSSVDPKQRGPSWLAFGDTQHTALLDPTKDRGLTEEEERRALESAASKAKRGAGKKRA